MLDGRADRFRRTGNGLICPEVRKQLVELSHLAVGSPPLIAVTGVAQVCMCNLLKPTTGIEPCGNFVGNSFILYKAIRVRSADGLFIELLRVEQTAFDTGDLCPHYCSTIFDILRAILGPDIELSLMKRQSLQVLLALVRCNGVAGCSARQCGIKVKVDLIKIAE